MKKKLFFSWLGLHGRTGVLFVKTPVYIKRQRYGLLWSWSVFVERWKRSFINEWIVLDVERAVINRFWSGMSRVPKFRKCNIWNGLGSGKRRKVLGGILVNRDLPGFWDIYRKGRLHDDSETVLLQEETTLFRLFESKRTSYSKRSTEKTLNSNRLWDMSNNYPKKSTYVVLIERYGKK